MDHDQDAKSVYRRFREKKWSVPVRFEIVPVLAGKHTAGAPPGQP